MFKLNNTTYTLQELMEEYPNQTANIEELETIGIYELAISDMINPENTQRLLYNQIVDAADVEYHKAEIQLAKTNQYYDWKDTAMDQLAALVFEYDKSSFDLLALDGIVEQLQIVNDYILEFNRTYGERELLTLSDAFRIYSV